MLEEHQVSLLRRVAQPAQRGDRRQRWSHHCQEIRLNVDSALIVGSFRAGITKPLIRFYYALNRLQLIN